MTSLNQKGSPREAGVIAQVLMLLILAAGLGAGIYLVKNPQIFRSRASLGTSISFVDANGSPITSTTTSIVKVKFVAPEWTQPSSSPSSSPSVVPTPPPTPSPSPVACSAGDVNGDGKVDMVDSQLVLRIVAGLTKPTTEQTKNADVDGDGQITSVDSLKIQRVWAGLDKTFAACSKVKGVSTAVVTASIVLAEDPNFTVNKKTVSFTSLDTYNSTSYTFSSSAAGSKTLYAKFVSSTGTEQNANPFPATINLTTLASPSPSSSAHPAVNWTAVSFSPPSSSLTPNGKGAITVTTTSANTSGVGTNAKGYISGTFSNLLPNTLYTVWFVQKDKLGYNPIRSDSMISDSKGTVNFFGDINFEVYFRNDQPIVAVNVAKRSLDFSTGACSKESPCVSGLLTLPAPTSTPSPSPSASSTPSPTPKPSSSPSTGKGPFTFTLSNSQTTLTCNKTDINCKYTTTLTARNKLTQPLFKTTVYKSDSSKMIEGYNQSVVSSEAINSGQTALNGIVNVKAPSTLKTGLYYATIYLDGQVCNMNTNPPNSCIFYGASSLDVKVTVSSTTIKYEVVNKSP